MSTNLRFLGFLCAVTAAVWPAACQAYVHRINFPLSGYREYAAGKGQVYFAQRFGETDKDGSTLIVEVSNVPLPAGTELIVLVHEREIGSFKLKSDRSGRFVLESTPQKAVPRLSAGSMVSVRLPAGGSTVLW